MKRDLRLSSYTYSSCGFLSSNTLFSSMMMTLIFNTKQKKVQLAMRDTSPHCLMFGAYTATPTLSSHIFILFTLLNCRNITKTIFKIWLFCLIHYFSYVRYIYVNSNIVRSNNFTIFSIFTCFYDASVVLTRFNDSEMTPNRIIHMMMVKSKK